ncbi:hypothetical protein NX794_08150 [Streptomyces sp. LP11]|uniref:DUF4232 domain-containing protein n=1 Tax=Streptomyces pyxinicus TaxID=2970331 RepID=A0ABT2AY63_9ACTN|nr:hypothetical protein [Streptomyces sp. LP11]MCS0601202.1 hypothetical protein [Streptomyces sp. LP11]
MNHRPDAKGPEPTGPDREGFGPDREGFGADREGFGVDSGAFCADSDGSGADEPALRRLLHTAVEDVTPRTGTLDHLRRAVPARRARKRQAVVGMAAAALFIGTAIPALVHVSGAGGSDPNTAMAGQSSQARGGTGQDADKGGTAGGGQGGGSTDVKPGKESGKPGEKSKGADGRSGAVGGVGPSASVASGVASCTAEQLGSATGAADAPDTAGVVYGTFRVTNVSAAACTVGGPGSIGATAQGAADPAKITQARHVAGDAATSLPDPSLEVTTLVLQPGAAYEEKFAFVPSETCPTTGGGDNGGGDSGGPSPDPTPTGDAGAAGGSAGAAGDTAGEAPQLRTEGSPADGSVLVSHTAQAGGPTATAVVPGACAGTVYYTGVLAGA